MGKEAKYVIRLTEEERSALPELMGKPRVAAAKVLRARMALRGYPETFSFHRRKIMQHPCGNETQGDRKERVDAA